MVLQELGQARDTPDDIIFDHLQAAIYPGPADGLADPGRGRTVTVFHAGERCVTTWRAHYRADAMTLVASGAVSHDEIVALARSKIRRSRNGIAAGAAGRALCRRRHSRRGRSRTGPYRLCLSGLSNADDPDFYVAQLYAASLGGGMSSRLFQEAREKRGLCYSIYAFTSGFQDGGFLGVYAGTGEAEAGRNLRRDRGRDGRASPAP